MHKRLQDRTDQWHPVPPTHIHPWGEWTTHEIKSLRTRLHDLQLLLESVTDELDRRALMIEAEAKSKETRHVLHWLQVIMSSPTTPYLASLVVLLLTMLSNKPAAIDLAKELLRK